MDMRRLATCAAITLGAVVALAGCTGSDASSTTGAAATHSAPASTSAPPSPSPSASATLEPPVAGALPVPAYPASAIPWNQIGDGWFLLTYDPDSESDVWPELPEGMGEYPELDESVMLVSPAGDLYYVRSLAGIGNGSPVQWTGDALTILDGEFMREKDDVPQGPLLSLNLATGEAVIVNPLAYYAYPSRTLPNGNFVTQGGLEGSLSVDVIAPDLTVLTEICHSEGTATSVSPDGTRVVCLEYGDDATTQVMLYDVASGSGALIDTFKHGVWDYSTAGWWDDNSFVLTRWPDAGDPLRWAYDVSTKKLRELYPTLSDGTPAETVQGVAGYRLLAAGAAVEIQGFDGSLRAIPPCMPTAISGHFAIAVCLSETGQTDVVHAEVVVANLETGTLTAVASFDAGEGIDVRVFPAPGGEKTGLA